MIYGDESWYMYILVEKIIYDICLGITLTILKEDIEEDIEEF